MNRLSSNIIIGAYCRSYRVNVLKLTLKDLEGNDNIKTLSSFENGRSTNMNHLLKYVNRCFTKTQKLSFLQGLIEALERDK